jgi:hypothetical protein
MAHLTNNIEYPTYTNPFFRRASCVIDPQLREKLGVHVTGGIGPSIEEIRNPPVVNHGDVEVKFSKPGNSVIILYVNLNQ